MNTFKDFLDYSFEISNKIHLDVKTILFLAFILLLTNFLLKIVRRLVTKRLDEEDKGKFKAIFSFLKYFVYIIVIITALESSGVQVGVLLAGSAALLVGIGLGLQTLFQDIISGIFILLDKTLTVNDIVEVDGKIGKVLEIKLRTTRTVTIDDKVLIIPNHKFLTNSLFNWTQNGTTTIETLDIGVAYGSDVEKVKKILIGIAKEHPRVLKNTSPDVLFMDFADSSLQFRLRFSINDSYKNLKFKSDLRFVTDAKCREQFVEIPLPQRDVHFFGEKK